MKYFSFACILCAVLMAMGQAAEEAVNDQYNKLDEQQQPAPVSLSEGKKTQKRGLLGLGYGAGHQAAFGGYYGGFGGGLGGGLGYPYYSGFGTAPRFPYYSGFGFYPYNRGFYY